MCLEVGDKATAAAEFHRTRVGKTAFEPRGDVNKDGAVNLVDFETLSRALPADMGVP